MFRISSVLWIRLPWFLLSIEPQRQSSGPQSLGRSGSDIWREVRIVRHRHLAYCAPEVCRALGLSQFAAPSPMKRTYCRNVARKPRATPLSRSKFDFLYESRCCKSATTSDPAIGDREVHLSVLSIGPSRFSTITTRS